MRVTVVGPADQRVRRLLRELSEIEGIEASAGRVDDASHRDVTVGLHSPLEEHLEAARNCVEAGSHFISASHSSDVAEALMSNFSQTSGRGVVLGADWTPGITCAIASRAGMDDVEQVRISWVVSAAGSAGSLAVERALEAFSTRAIVFEGGSWRRVQAGQESEQVFLPEPMGWREVWNCAGAESLFLPTTNPNLSRVVVRGRISEPMIDGLMRRVAEASPERSRWIMQKAIRLPSRDSLGMDGGWSAARVDLYGKTSRSYAFMDQLSNLWTAPIVAILRLWNQTHIPAGAHPMHEVFEPADLIQTLMERGLHLARLEHGTRTMS